MEKHHKYMLLAIKAGYEAFQTASGGPFGAVMVNQKGEIMSTGTNEVLKQNDPTAHAEIVAIRKLKSYDLSDYTLYASGYPCPMCLGAILWSRIKQVYYCNTYTMAKEIGFDDGVFMQCLGEVYNTTPSLSYDSKTKLLNIKHLPMEEGKELYQAFNKSKKTIRY